MLPAWPLIEIKLDIGTMPGDFFAVHSRWGGGGRGGVYKSFTIRLAGTFFTDHWSGGGRWTGVTILEVPLYFDNVFINWHYLENSVICWKLHHVNKLCEFVTWNKTATQIIFVFNLACFTFPCTWDKAASSRR